MAKGSKSGGRNFKRGNPGGPGRPVLPEHLKEARKLTRAVFVAAAETLLSMTQAEFASACEENGRTILEHMVCAVIAQTYRRADHVRLDWMLNRLGT